MGKKIRDHIRSNVVGYVAVFIALSGTAYAVDGPLPGQNQVGSADIINDEVKTTDIRDANVSTADIHGDAVTTGKIADGAVSQAKLAPNAGPVGRSGAGGNCFDDDHNGEDCAIASIVLPRAARVLVIGTTGWGTASFDDTDPPGSDSDDVTSTKGTCVLTRNGATLSGTARTVGEVQGGGDETWIGGPFGGDVSTTTVTAPLTPGTYDFALRCTEQDGDIDWGEGKISAVMLGNG
jgi:hypothetical protein